MRVVAFLYLVIAAIVTASVVSGQVTHDIDGIVPLHSSRSDVEKQLGQSADSCRCIFRNARRTIEFNYAELPCKGQLYGWSVPKDTVLAFTVTPKVPFPISEINLDPNRFVETHSQDDAVTVYYTDPVAGIKYAVQDRHVIYIRHIPSNKDNRLRCAGFPTYDGGVTDYKPYDSFSSKSDVETRARLDNFAVQLTQASSLRGYIIAYAGKVARRGEGRKMADRARAYLVEKRNIPIERIVAVDGGFRTLPTYDFFLLPKTVLPPTATPTLSSKDVRIFLR